MVGGAVGYQRFFDATRKQVLMEVGYRFGTQDTEPDAYAGIVRYQSAMGQHFVWVVDAFAGYRELRRRRQPESLWGASRAGVASFDMRTAWLM